MNHHDCKSLAICLMNTQTLRKLNLQFNQIDDSKVKVLCEALTSNTILEDLGKFVDV